MEIDYGLLESEIKKIIQSNKTVILATSAHDRVTARAMFYFSEDINFFFHTASDSVKYIQMKENPNVALCMDNMQIEGKAEILDRSLNESTFIEKYKVEHPGSFKKYSSMQKSFAVSVSPILITLWKYENGNPYRDILDIKDHKAIREIYDTDDVV